MAITNNQQIEIKWYGGLQNETAIANAINATANDGSILFVPSGSNGGALYANGHQFGLDEQSIRALVYQISQNNTGDIVQLISAIDAQLTSLSGAIAGIQGQVNGIEVTGSANINVNSSTDENGTTFTISASGLATPGDIENAISGLNTSLNAEISGIKTSLTGAVSDLTGSIGSVYQYSQQVSGTVNTLSGTLDNLSGTVNSLTTTSKSTLDALHTLEYELQNPNNVSGMTSFLDTVYSVATGFLPESETGSPINIKQYVDGISGTLSSLSGSVASKIDNDTETYLVQGNDITITGDVAKNTSGSYTISLAENTKNTITSASSNSTTAINALGTLTETGAVKTYIDSAISGVNAAISGANSAASDAILRWQVIGNSNE